MFWLSSLLQVMVGWGVPSALQMRVALWFSRTLTVDGELSTSMMLGGTETIINTFRKYSVSYILK
jgi:hypothetical protein